MVRNDGRIPADLMPYFDLWFAVLALMIEDGRDYVRLGESSAGHRRPAYEDLMTGGPQTRRLAKYCCVDPEYVTRAFKRYIAQDRELDLAA